MKLYSINTGFFKLDGGAMFGVIPKSLWQKTNPSDANNMIDIAARALLIEDGKKLILIDNGLGNKQKQKFFDFYYLYGDDTLEKSLAKYGFTTNDITDVILSHLHFDHCGGSIKWNSSKTKLELTFPNATYWSNEKHWHCATQPNRREAASFLKENILPVQECGHLKFIPIAEMQYITESPCITFQNLPDLFIMYSEGHTESMILPHVIYKNKNIVYAADFIPTSGHIPLPYIMGYDTNPLITLDEKEKFLNRASEHDYILFFEHDPVIECCSLQKTEKGVKMKDKFSLADFFSR